MAECHCPVFIPDKKSPLNLMRQHTRYHLVPCGKCVNCLANRASQWSVRLMQEEKVSDTAYFITLTYDNDNVHITPNGYMGLAKEHLQKWFKRVRAAHSYHSKSSRPLKYFAVGEYGNKKSVLKRPHYHVLLFNADLKVMFSKKDLLALRLSGYNGKHIVESLQWDKGHVTVGQVTGASVGYTLKYISKPYKNFRRNDDRERPFSVMSKGLGISYILNEKMIAWHFADPKNRMYINLPGGVKCTMPRYYKERIYYDGERQDISEIQKYRFVDEILNDLLRYSDEELEVKKRNRRESKFAAARQHVLESA